MEIVSKEEFLSKKNFFLEEMKRGKIFVYPTDTIYGIGCDASNSESVDMIRKIKKRDERPFSVIVPGVDWVRKNCFVSEKVESWLKKFPGPYTLILELKNWEAVTKEVNSGADALGIRIPDHWFSGIISELGSPFITTSVNLSGGETMRFMDDISEEIKSEIDYIIDEGLISRRPSTIVNLVRNKEVIKER